MGANSVRFASPVTKSVDLVEMRTAKPGVSSISFEGEATNVLQVVMKPKQLTTVTTDA